MSIPEDDRVQKISNFQGTLTSGEIDKTKLEMYLKDLDNDVKKIQTYVSRTGSLAAVVDAGFFVDRGDPTAADYAVGDLTTDNTWNDLDLSSIVPEGAIAVALRVSIQDDATNSKLLFRKNGNTNDINDSKIRTEVANIYIDSDLIVPCDADRVIEYKGDNLAFAAISIVVKGWWI